MKRAKLAEILRKDYVQTVIMVVIIIVSVVAFWYGLRFGFKTEHPLLAVASGSMRPTLEVGDLILVHGVHNACKIHAAPKDADQPGDIIVFHRPRDPKRELIVHRAVNKTNRNGLWYFKTQGDANMGQDIWEVKESDIVGKYTGAKAPLLGHIALFFEPLHVKVAFIMLWIVLLMILEVLPLSRKRVEEEHV
ncbi:MAG: signal peptidase I [Candidatus Bathyarchaeia archaeon]